jgi:hypothetical protein
MNPLARNGRSEFLGFLLLAGSLRVLRIRDFPLVDGEIYVIPSHAQYISTASFRVQTYQKEIFHVSIRFHLQRFHEFQQFVMQYEPIPLLLLELLYLDS